MKRSRILLFAAGVLGASLAQAALVDQLLDGYRGSGAGPFSAESGAQMWTQKHTIEGDARSCATCHGEDLTRAGKHARTGKVIEPLAPSVNSKRLSDAAEVEKWFKRNCKWVLGRECSPQEKGDFLSFIRSR